jgi:hypothetical protein
MSEQPQQPRMQVQLPDHVVAGEYADFVSVWHTKDAFVLDFAVVAQPPTTAHDETGQFLVLPTRIVSRVRIPPAQVFEIMKALEQQLTAWEHETGRSSGTGETD